MVYYCFDQAKVKPTPTEPAPTSERSNDAVAVSDMRACIEELSEADESERSTLPCAVRWNEVRSALYEKGAHIQPDNLVDVRRTVHPASSNNQAESIGDQPDKT